MQGCLLITRELILMSIDVAESINNWLQDVSATSSVPTLSQRILLQYLMPNHLSGDKLELVVPVQFFIRSHTPRCSSSCSRTVYGECVATLHAEFRFHNFVGLHKAWEQCLDTSQLNKLFYRDIANWYFWVLDHPDVIPPRDIKTDEQKSIFTQNVCDCVQNCWQRPTWLKHSAMGC